MNESLESDVKTATTLLESSFAPNNLKDSDIYEARHEFKDFMMKTSLTFVDGDKE